ncbi:precorrin-6y C5,15-methyltransferase (decarboxylating) subunit CbiE [Anaerovibrio sp.]|uniref:precorrin-6y C5,15-methyltransferase (decarboxylating) subunit CbiE n=1 Tax=Anaerovibrio sp. TaxID=1872532 RepID=UPI003F18D6BB
MEHKIIVAGIGPGHPDYMVPEARRAIREARLLAGGRRALSQYAGEGVQEQCVIGADIPAVMDFIRRGLRHDDVVVMVSGDPGYYSLLDALRREFPAELIRVIPGISAMQMAFARLALPWHEADLWSFHGRVPEEGRLAYAPGRLAGMLTDGKYNSHTIPRLLLERGWPGETGLAVCSRLSYEDEVVIRTTLAEAENYPVYSHCILVVTA